MDNKRNYQDDLAGIKGLPLNPKDTPFIVPSDYFNTLEAKIKRRVAIMSDAEASFEVPKQYFESLSDRIFARIENESYQNDEFVSQEEVKEKPFIIELRKEVPTSGFVAPPQYFDVLSEKIKAAVDPLNLEENTREISFPRKKKRYMSLWMRYAAAACITIGLGVYGFFQYQSNSFERKLKDIPENEIVSYLQYYGETGDAALLEAQFDGVVQMNQPTFSEKDIEAYLDYSI
ncbi:hypothetical protein [Olivibacter sp. XZL3]|uniref:hypothetical protein n=1 Tax=Olivibacter sp. XZL3 TaxID=1735116 RepID=UPI001066BD2B|nr:hypothetical protein [Olivibacter sp. XZL3]